MRRLLTSTVAATALILAPQARAIADVTNLSGGSSGDRVNLGAGSAKVSSGGGGGSGPRCAWTPATVGELIDFGGQDRTVDASPLAVSGASERPSIIRNEVPLRMRKSF